MSATTERRLAAIVHADLAGFTRMMEGAETRTFRHLKKAQIDVWRPAIQQGGGRMVGTAGDAMLAEFGSAVSAVAVALDIQKRMADFNEALESAQRMLFRIGVHLGEVIVDEEDQNIFGDGVNLAARIQALAEPGGIAVSRAVRDLVELRTDHVFEDAGDHRLKNVSRPIQVFHIRPARPARLLFAGTDSQGQPYAFDVDRGVLAQSPEGLVIGRASDQCALVLAHPTISRSHARLRLEGAGLLLEDLGSTNGTEVNGKAVDSGKSTVLAPGDTLRLGDIRLTMRQL